jgi:hypothetical protein
MNWSNQSIGTMELTNVKKMPMRNVATINVVGIRFVTKVI